MVGIKINSNLGEVAQRLIAKLQAINTSDMSREVSTKMLPVVHHRIHQEGLDGSGSPIGTYSKGYMSVRTGNFKNNLVSRGSNKGKPRNAKAGAFTKGKNKGQERPRYNWTPDTKVVLALTKQMENDFSVQPADSGNFGLGFTNNENLAKALFCENTYKKEIYKLTPFEQEESLRLAEKYVEERLK